MSFTAQSWKHLGELHNTMIAEVQSCEMTYLQHLFQPLWNKITNQFVILETYNPGVKRLTKHIYLPKKNEHINPIHADFQKQEQKQIENKECIIS